MRPIPVIAFFLLFSHITSAQQYTLNGNASQIDCHCYRLTNNAGNQSGSVWNNNRIDLSNSFDFVFDVYLGVNNSPGADGIAFVLQPISTSVGSTGGGLGFQGVTPSIGVTLDTYQNTNPDNDPAFDHIAIQRNGDLSHVNTNNLAGPMQASSTNANIEDGVEHKLRIVWDAVAKKLTTYFDGVERVSTINDFVNTTFGGNPQVFWGFTGSTGGESNEQRFCTALSPAWNFSPTQKRCIGEPIQFMNATVSFTTIAKMYWDFGDGSNIDSANLNPIHTYTAAGNYTVTQKVRGADGCEETNTQTVIVGSKPFANFSINDSCVNNTIQFTSTPFASVGTVNNWYWELDNAGTTSTLQNPTSVYATHGIKNIRLAVKSLQGCTSDTLDKTIRIYARPVADFTFTDSLCLGSTYNFTDNSSLADGPVSGWSWFVDGSSSSAGSNSTFSQNFTTAGIHTVSLVASGMATMQCSSPAVTKNVFVVDKPRAAIKAVTGCQAQQIQLLDSSYTNDGFAITSWWWDLGNGQFSTQRNPTVTYTTAGPVNIRLVVHNSRNCKSDTLDATIQVAEKPLAKFGHSEGFCNNSLIEFYDSSLVNNAVISQWEWIHNNAVFSTEQHPSSLFPSGSNAVGLSVVSNYGCKSDTVYQTFNIKSKPEVTMNFGDACKLSDVSFTGRETTAIGITSWHWDFGDGNTATGNPATHAYNSNNTYTVKMYAISAEGCSSDTMQGPIIIYGTDAFAGNDTIAAASQPIQLNASGGLSYEWTPSTGLSATDVPDPVATNNVDRIYYLRAFTPEGCESFDTISIKIYKGPDIYVPTGFTPNGDGRNDVLKPIAVGISRFEFFVVFNRYGEQVFKSTNAGKGWDGRIKGQEQQTGSFVWMVSGIDFRGNKIFKKGTVLLIR